MKQKNQGQNNESVYNKNKTEGPSRFKKIKLRTMNSDKNSIQEQGGGEPKSYAPDESGQNQQQNNTPPQNLPQQNNQGGNQGQNKSFNNKPFENSEGEQFPPVNNQQNQGDEGGNDFPPQPMNQGGGAEPPQEGGSDVTPIGPEKKVDKGKGNKKLFIGILVAIIVLGILAAVYFFVLPMLSSNEGAPADENNQPAATATTTEDGEEGGEVDVPTVPSADEEATPADEEQTDNTTTTETDTEDESQDVEEEEETADEGTSEIPANSHQTLFASPADSTVEKVVSTVSLDSVKNALKISSTEVPLFREIVLTDEDENIIQADELLGVFGPEVFTEVKDKFQADPTVYTYTDDSGTWMGMILQAKSSANLDDVKSKVSVIEDSVATVKNFFLNEVGAETSWKDGGVGDVTSRYLSLGSGNASFNYGWSGDKLIISTSYQSFKEAVNKM